MRRLRTGFQKAVITKVAKRGSNAPGRDPIAQVLEPIAIAVAAGHAQAHAGFHTQPRALV